MTGNEYQKLAARTINPELSKPDQMMHALHGMSGEIGEIHSLFQKAYQGHDIDLAHLKSELGDLIWFAMEFASSIGWAAEDIMQGNIDKLRARYPDGFDAEKSLHRREGDV